ncbi:MAG: hypothetical protein AAGC82_16820 [Pseudomonadota bacterium]
MVTSALGDERNGPLLRGLIFVTVAALLWIAATVLPTALAQERGLATIVAAILGVFGTFVSAIAGVLIYSAQQASRERTRLEAEQTDRRKRREAEARAQAEAVQARNKRTYRIASALRAEISASLTRLARNFSNDGSRAYVRRSLAVLEPSPGQISQAGMPKGVFLRENTIYETQLPEVLDLPETVIRALVQYYQDDEYLTLYGERMSDGHFSGIDAPRQKLAIVIYAWMGQGALQSAIEVTALLDYYLDVVHHLENTTSSADDLDIDLERPSSDGDTVAAMFESLVDRYKGAEFKALYGEITGSTPEQRLERLRVEFDLLGAGEVITPLDEDRA